MGEPQLIGSLPPNVHRDWRVHTWIAASIISWMGNSAWTVALAWQAVQMMSPSQAGMVIAIATIPQALLTLPGGVIADRVDTRRVLVAAQLSHTLILVAGALMWGRVDNFWLLVMLGVGFGSVTGLSSPAAATLGRQLVRTDDLATVTAWNQIGSRVARMAGAPLGAVLVVRDGLTAVMWVDAASFLVVAAALTWVVRPRYRIHDDVAEDWTHSLRDGLAYLGRDRTALVFVIGLCGLNVFSSPLVSLGVPLRVTASGWPGTTLGLAESVFSAAALAGSALSLRLQPSRQVVSAYLLLIAQGVAYAGIALDSQTWLLGSMVVIGSTAGCASVWLSAQFVVVVQPAYLGRVASVSSLGDLLLVPFAAPAFGALTSRVGISWSPLILALGMVTMCAAILARPDIRRVGCAPETM